MYARNRNIGELHRHSHAREVGDNMRDLHASRPIQGKRLRERVEQRHPSYPR